MRVVAFRPWIPKKPVPKKGPAKRVVKILNEANHDPVRQLPLNEIVIRVVSLAQVMLEKQFYPYQTALASRVVESLLLHDGDAITALFSRQSGKCLAKGTPVLLYSGEIIPVEEVRVGDFLMGDDSTPRKVLSLASGTETMYRVQPRCNYAEPYEVNASHILSVVERKCVKGRRKLIKRDISVSRYLQLPKWKRDNSILGYKVPVEFEPQSVFIEPYWLGLWLGDGRSDSQPITCSDAEVMHYISNYAARLGMNASVYAEKGVCVGVSITKAEHTGKYNKLVSALKSYGLINNKHIPLEFFANSRKVRLELLAGLIDSDGYKGKFGYEIASCNRTLALEIQKLARSLGFRCSIARKVAECQTGACSVVWRLNIYGKVWEIPVKVERKKFTSKKLRENPLTFGFDLVKLPPAQYYGFEIDGNKRFLLGDFTVTHNTECVGGTVAAAAVILPVLAKQFPLDWKLNVTDEQGNYRGFAFGLKVGIYAPRLDQSQITFERVRGAFETDSAKKVLQELHLAQKINNGNTVILTHGSSIMCESASEQSKIEGATHSLLIIEEAQDISDIKVRKSLHPMVASTMGTVAKIGTASTKKCDFYNAIQENRRMELLTGKRNHFYFPYTVCSKYNSLYRRYIEKEKVRIGEDSDEFKMSYGGEWIFERGMFVTQDVLFHPKVAITHGLWSLYHLREQPGILKHLSVVAGIDWGSSSDSTVVCLMAVDWLNPLDEGETYDSMGAHRFRFFEKHVIGWVEFIGDNYEYQFGEVFSILSRIPNLRKITTDSNTCGKPIFDRLAATFAPLLVEVEPFNFQPRVKSDGYKSLASDLWANRITFPAHQSVRSGIHYRKFVMQMLDLKKDYKNGIMQVSHPDERGAHDDWPDSFCLAAWGCNTPSLLGAIEFGNSNPLMG